MFVKTLLTASIVLRVCLSGHGVRWLQTIALAYFITACGGSAGRDSSTLQLNDGQIVDAESEVIRISTGGNVGLASVSSTLLRQGALPECQARFNSLPVADSLIDACLADQPSCTVFFIPESTDIAVFPPPLYAPVGLEYELSFLNRNGVLSDPVNAVFCLNVGANLPPQPRADTYQLVYPSTLQVGGVNYDQRCEKIGDLSGVLANDDDDQHVSNTCLQAELLEPPRFASNPDGFERSFATDGSFRYQAFGDLPPVDASGRNVDSFTYRVTDGVNPVSEPVRVEIIYTGENAVPVAMDDSFSVEEDSIGNIFTVLDNDTDPDALPLSLRVINNGPGNGIANIRNGVLIDYQPAAGFSGTDSFTYTVVDSGGLTATAAVVVNVLTVNDPPEANNDSVSTLENTPVEVAVLTNDTDPEGDALTITQIGTPANGSVTDNGNGVILYTPATDFFGTDLFEYTVSDDNGGSAVGIVSIVVTSVNAAPTANSDNADTSENESVVVNVLANDTDTDATDILVITEVTEPANGTATVENGSVTYQPDAGYSGSDSFEYTVSDGNGGTDSALVTVFVASVNVDPIATDDSATTTENTAITVFVLANDSDPNGDSLTLELATLPARGTATTNANAIEYQPLAGESGVDSFTYRLLDGNGGSDIGNVTVTIVQNPNSPDETPTPGEDDPVVVIDDPPVEEVDVPTEENDTPNDDGNPPTDEIAPAVEDDGASEEIDTSEDPVNNSPIAEDDFVSTPSNRPLSINILSNDIDQDGDALQVSILTPAINGFTNVRGNGTIQYRPGNGFVGIDSFVYSIADGKGGSDTAIVTVTVLPR